MQEAFARFIARFPEPPSDMNVDAYLHATARNVFLKQIRDRRETPAGDIETVLGADDDLERDPERAMLLVEQQTLVRRCAAMLTRRQRNALRMCEVEGNSYAEIGSELGIGVDAVGQVVSRARTRLRGALRRAQIDLDHLSPECRALLGPLSDYVDGRARTTSSEIESHLAECSACPRDASFLPGSGLAPAWHRATRTDRRALLADRSVHAHRRRRTDRARSSCLTRDRRRDHGRLWWIPRRKPAQQLGRFSGRDNDPPGARRQRARSSRVPVLGAGGRRGRRRHRDGAAWHTGASHDDDTGSAAPP